MQTKRFECLRCGKCCDKILRNTHGVTVGLYLRPTEVKLFEDYPSAVVPYIGIAENGSGEPEKVICYQMATEPCPLYDVDAKRCMRYDSRPVACRAYPMSLDGGRLTIESSCKWLARNKNGLKFGKTSIDAVEEIQNAYEIHVGFGEYGKTFNKNAVAMIYDAGEKKWERIDIIE